MASRSPGAWRLADGAVIALLLAAIGLPPARMVFCLGRRPAGDDRRALARFPTLEWSGAGLRSLPQAVDRYFRDHFGFRDKLIDALAATRVRGLGVSSCPNVLLGRDGWMYYTKFPVGSDYEQVRPFTDAELARWQGVLEQRQEWLAQRGCRYLLFVPPDKQTVYPEYLEPRWRARHASGRLEQLVQHLRRHSNVTLLDVRQPLRRASRRERTYCLRDSHWNLTGAFVGYRELAQVLSGWFPQIRPFERSQFDEVAKPAVVGDLVHLLGLRGEGPETFLFLEPRFSLQARVRELPRTWVRADLQYGPPAAWDHPDTSLPRAVLFHDSFALGSFNLLAEHFQHLVSVWHDDFLQDLVEREKPDVVIHELVERKLGFVIPNDLE
jgi:alginate O-acetyltransferase complex protein AlgJ